MTDVRRVLVTGSSTWAEQQTIAEALLEAWRAALQDGAEGIVVVHGACPTGVDKIAADWAEHNDVAQEPNPADWDTHGRSAGLIRNQHMVELGADLCLVFIDNCASARCRRPKPHESHGAHHTADLAQRDGIAVRKWTE